MAEILIRTMEVQDYEAVYELWLQIHGFGMRSIDDSKEGVLRFLKRNPNTSVVALDKERVVGSILCGHDGRRGMSVSRWCAGGLPQARYWKAYGDRVYATIAGGTNQ